jgi:hypothetical protein
MRDSGGSECASRCAGHQLGAEESVWPVCKEIYALNPVQDQPVNTRDTREWGKGFAVNG